jgi:uncharacterized protein
MMARITPLLVALFLTVSSLLAATPQVLSMDSGLSDRMRERLPVIDTLKSEGRVGENNLGYLSVRGVLSANENSVVASENADRAQVYKMIAERTQVDAVSVGKARAEQIAQRSASGVWLQDASGRWYRK